MEEDKLTDRALICSSVYELSVRLGHLHIHYHSHDSIIVSCGNKDLFCLAFVILIGCGADSTLLIVSVTKLKTIMLNST